MVDLMVSEQQSGTAGKHVPAGFKLTEVGVIPQDWEVKTIGQLNPFITSGSRGWADFYVDYGDLFVRITNMSRNSIYLDTNTSENKYVSLPATSTEGKRTQLNNGDVLISITADIGIIGYIDEFIAKPAYINQHISLVRFDDDSIDNKFVAYFLASENVQKKFLANSDVGAKAGMNLNGVRSIIFAVPTIQEQSAIAEALTDVDTLIVELKKVLAKKQAIKTATMQQLLTGKTRLPQFALRKDGTVKGYKKSELGEIPEDWSIENFSTLATLRNERINPRTKDIECFCIELEHIISEYGQLNGFTETSDTSSIKNVFSPNDILFGKLRSYLKKYWKATQSGVCSTEIWVLKTELHKAIPEFIFQTVKTDRFVQTASEAYGTHMPRADWKIIKELQVATPSIEEQTAITAILSDMDKDIQTLQQRLDKTRQLKQGMMQELLTGKTRLI
ncbi:TPA: restriction endonuclease subunit S [Klebsiella variicola]|uniref:restriction endonuclease subunit S n=1 Tax=Klebsiella variicola TaxID=244366 RepID=UPI001D105C86|nr:restriction endonuclease subunit S [Klebsiella variicola]